MGETSSQNRDRQSFGISMPPELAKQVEDPLTYGDTRSARIRHLIRMGIKAEQGLGELNGNLDEREKEHVVKQAVINYRKSE